MATFTMIKAVLLDFDGTLVTKDILSELCAVVGKKRESEILDQDFHNGIKPGLSALIERINFLQGLSLKKIKIVLQKNPFLMPGAEELCDFLHKHQILSILASGNILPVLEYYQKLLGIDFIIGAKPHIANDIIQGITETDFPYNDFKLEESKKILAQKTILPSDVVAIGDAPGDKSRFLFAGHSIAINPKGGIEQYSSYVIHDTLSAAIPLIETL